MINIAAPALRQLNHSKHTSVTSSNPIILNASARSDNNKIVTSKPSQTAASSRTTSRAVSPRRSRPLVALDDAEFDGGVDSPDSATTITPAIASSSRQNHRRYGAGGFAVGGYVGDGFMGDSDVQKFVEGLDKWSGLMKKAIVVSSRCSCYQYSRKLDHEWAADETHTLFNRHRLTLWKSRVT